MEIFLIVLCVIVFILAIVVFSPVVIAFDSRARSLRLRWLFALEFHVPLPGSQKPKALYIFRKPVALRERPPAAGPESILAKAPARAAEAPALPKKRKQHSQFLMRCLGNAAIRHALARQLSKLLKRVSGSIHLTRISSHLSLPDPALNGMLAGALASSAWARRLGLRVNFSGENSLFIELRFYPHRVLKGFLFFLPGLPYRAMFRQWRAFSAARPHGA